MHNTITLHILLHVTIFFHHVLVNALTLISSSLPMRVFYQKTVLCFYWVFSIALLWFFNCTYKRWLYLCHSFWLTLPRMILSSSHLRTENFMFLYFLTESSILFVYAFWSFPLMKLLYYHTHFHFSGEVGFLS